MQIPTVSVVSSKVCSNSKNRHVLKNLCSWDIFHEHWEPRGNGWFSYSKHRESFQSLIHWNVDWAIKRWYTLIFSEKLQVGWIACIWTKKGRKKLFVWEKYTYVQLTLIDDLWETFIAVFKRTWQILIRQWRGNGLKDVINLLFN